MDWKIAVSSDLLQIKNLILSREKYYVALAAKLKTKGKIKLPGGNARLYVLKAGKEITGLLYISPYGQILPLLPQISSSSPDLQLSNLLDRQVKRIFNICGLREEVLYVRKQIAIPPSHVIDYYLMVAEVSETAPFSPLESSPVHVRKAVPADSDGLLPLQILYDKEEVVLNPQNYSPKRARHTLDQYLKNQLVFCAELGGELVAKVNTNAQGFRYAQVGGVFTQKRWRNKGIATALMARLREELRDQGKGISLFVKKENAPALTLYQKLRFTQLDDFQIVYYST